MGAEPGVPQRGEDPRGPPNGHGGGHSGRSGTSVPASGTFQALPKAAAKAVMSPSGRTKSSGGTGRVGTRGASPRPPRWGGGGAGPVELTCRVVGVGATEPPGATAQLRLRCHCHCQVPVPGHPHTQAAGHGHPVTWPGDTEPCARGWGGTGIRWGQGFRWQLSDHRVLVLPGAAGGSSPPCPRLVTLGTSPLCR